MAKVIIPQMGLDIDLFQKIESERSKDHTPRATYINQKLREALNISK